jgi:hypothetical protein
MIPDIGLSLVLPNFPDFFGKFVEILAERVLYTIIPCKSALGANWVRLGERSVNCASRLIGGPR